MTRLRAIVNMSRELYARTLCKFIEVINGQPVISARFAATRRGSDRFGRREQRAA
jgi:hypothetical protein